MENPALPFPQCLIQFLRHSVLNPLIELRIIEQLCKGIVVVKETLSHDISDSIWEQGLYKHLSAIVPGILSELFYLRVFHEHLIDTLNDDTISISEITAETLIHLVNDALKGILFLGRGFRSHAVAGREHGRFLIKQDSSTEGFRERGIPQFDLIIDIHEVCTGSGEQLMETAVPGRSTAPDWRCTPICRPGVPRNR